MFLVCENFECLIILEILLLICDVLEGEGEIEKLKEIK